MATVKNLTPIFNADSFRTPGPGTYKPELKYPPNERTAPRYSMSARTRLRKLDSNPAPNTYSVPSALGSRVPNRRSSPSYTLRGRTKSQGFSEDLAKTPGPAGYNTVNPQRFKRSAPQYSLGARSFLPGDNTQKPGPGTYSPERVLSTMWRGRASSMGIRHSEFITPLIVE